MDLTTANTLLGWGTLALQVTTLVLLAAFFLQRRVPSIRDTIDAIKPWAIPVALALSLAGSLATLYYSHVLGIEPCPLCWWQRVFLYPQVILFAVALIRKERVIACYSIALSAIGAGVALYQHALQVLPDSGLPCPASGTVSCAQRFLFEFNYITYPLAAVTLFAAIIVLMLIIRRRSA